MTIARLPLEAALPTLLLALAADAGAALLWTSNRADETPQGVPILEEELALFDTSAAPGSEVSGPVTPLGPALFLTSNEDIEAFSVRNGVFYFSVASNATLADNGLVVDNDDVVAFDPNAAAGSRASIYYDPQADSANNLRVDAISFADDGDLMLSFTNDETFAGISVLDGDVVRFDPMNAAATVSIFLSETLFGADVDVDAFSFVAPDEVYLSTTRNDRELPGLTGIRDGDVVRWDGVTASLEIAEDDFEAGNLDVDAVSRGPEPATGLLLGLGLAGLAWRRRARGRGAASASQS